MTSIEENSLNNILPLNNYMMNKGIFFNNPSITILGTKLPVEKTDNITHDRYTVKLGQYNYLIACYWPSQWTDPDKRFKSFKDKLYLEMQVAEECINEFAAKWEDITIPELGEMYQAICYGGLNEYLSSKFGLPKEANTWMNSDERRQAIWEYGADAYKPNEEVIEPGKPLTWLENKYFTYALTTDGAMVIDYTDITHVKNGTSFKTKGMEFSLRDGTWVRIGI